MRVGLLVAGLLVTTPAWGQAGKVAKAEKLFAKHQAGAGGALEKAWDAIGDAKSHPSTRDEASTWLVVAKLTEAWADVPNAPVKDVPTESLAAYDTVIGKDSAKAHTQPVLEAVMRIGNTELAMATNAFEGDRMEDAVAHLVRVRKAWALGRQLGASDTNREIDTLRLSTLAAVETGDFDGATTFHAELDEAGGRRTGTTLAVSKALRKGRSPKDALAFLAPIADAHPDDAALLEARIALLTELGDTDGVRAVLDGNADQIGRAVGITLVHAKARAALEDWSAALDAYAKAYALDARHQEVLRGYAAAEMHRARDASAKAEATKKWAERKALRAEKVAAFEHARDLLQASRELEPGHLPTLERLREVYDEVETDDREEIQALDEAIREAKAAGG